MKKLLFYAAALLAAISFSACSNDDDETTLPATPENIAGTWQTIHEEGWEIDEGGEKDTWSGNLPNEEGCYTTISFDKNDTFVMTDYYGDDEIPDTINGTYSISGNKITLTAMGSSITLEIKNLTRSKLVTIERVKDNGIISIEVIMTFKRIE